MTTRLSPRAVFGVIIPSTNTVVETEFNQMRPPGVSWHSGRIYIPDPVLDDDETFVKFLENMRVEIGRAVRDVLTADIDYLVMGMSAETFWGGKAGAGRFMDWMSELSGGLGLTSGAMACDAALKVYGARRIAVVTPYQPVGDEQVRAFFEEMGYEVAGVRGLKCPTATSIAAVSPERIKAALEEVDGPGVDALVQAGTNLAGADVAPELEAKLGKPVLSINTITAWHALRSQGITDRIEGFGSLLLDH